MRAQIFLNKLILMACASAAAHGQAVEEPPSTPERQTIDVPQSPAPSAEATESTTPTISVTGSRESRRDDTASKIVVRQEELVKFGDTNLTDTLKRLPGVTVNSGPAGGIALRGLGSGYTQILLNGEKAPTGFSLDSLTPEMVERVEILRSATADLRAESIAGSINIILRKIPKTSSRDVKLGLGNSRGKWTPTISWQKSEQLDDLSYTLNASLGRREFLVTETDVQTGLDALDTQNMLRTGIVRVKGRSDTLTMAPSVSRTLENGDTLAVQGFLNANRLSRYGDLATTALIGNPEVYPRDLEYTNNDIVQGRTDLNWTHKFSRSARLATKLSLTANRLEGEFREQGYSAAGVANLDDVTLSHMWERGINATGKYSTPYFNNHVLGLGWDGSVLLRDEDRIQTLQTTELIQSNLDFDAQINRVSLYAQDEWNVTPRWSLYLGVRWEQIDTQSQGNSFDDIDNQAQVVSPMAQSLWKLPGTQNDQIRVALSRTYNSPQIASLIPRPYTSTNNTALDPDLRGNPNLRPELALGLDMAYEHFGADGALLSLGAYVRSIDGIIRNEVTLNDGRWVLSPINGGDALTWGIETDSKLPLSYFFADAPPVDFRFNLTRNWSAVDEVPGPNNRIDQQTRLSSTFAADYRLNDSWTTGGGFSFKSGGPIRTTLYRIDTYSTRRELDFYALWSLSTSSKVRLSLSNLLRQDLVTGNNYFDSRGALNIVTNRVSPLTVRVNMEIRY